MSFRRLVSASILLGAAACAPVSVAPGDPHDAAADAVLPDATPDVPPDDAAHDAAVAHDAAGAYGVCGLDVHRAFCACVSEGCRAAALTSDVACNACTLSAAAGCCPTENQALDDCQHAAEMPDDAGPGCSATDQRCLDDACPDQGNALSTCLIDRAGSDPTCLARYVACTGTLPVRCP